MKTLEQELEALEKKAAKERWELESKHAILAKLPIGEYAPPFIHHHKLWGSMGSINFSMQRYSSIATGKSPTADLLRQLLVALPPADMMLWRDGAVSFRPEPESYTSNGEATDIDPVKIHIDPGISGSTSVEWYGTLDGDLWGVKVEFPLHNAKVGALDLKYRYYVGNNGVEISVERCGFQPKPVGAKKIKYAGGGSTDPGSFVVYWERGHNTDVPALFE